MYQYTIYTIISHKAPNTLEPALSSVYIVSNNWMAVNNKLGRI
jgi:hypothetical protein